MFHIFNMRNQWFTTEVPDVKNGETPKTDISYKSRFCAKPVVITNMTLKPGYILVL